MSKVIGKFRVASVEDRGEVTCWNYETQDSRPVPQVAVKLQAVTDEMIGVPGGKFENEAFYRSTPQGAIEMVVQNPDAAEQFQTGDFFYMTLERISQPD